MIADDHQEPVDPASEDAYELDRKRVTQILEAVEAADQAQLTALMEP